MIVKKWSHCFSYQREFVHRYEGKQQNWFPIKRSEARDKK